MRVVMRVLSVVMLTSVLLPLPGAALEREAPKMAGGGTALVVIDIQSFYFEGGKTPLTGPIEASLKAKALIERFRAKRWPVVHVQHLPKDAVEPDPAIADPQYRFHSNVLPLPGETLIGKHHASSFRDTRLLALLREQGVTRLVIAGMQTHMCVEAAARAAADLGFEVTVIHDACATRPLKFGDVEVPAAHVHAAALAAMQAAYARVVSTEEWLAEMR